MSAKIIKSALINLMKSPWRVFRKLTRRALIQLLVSDTAVQKYVATSQLPSDQLTNQPLGDSAKKANEKSSGEDEIGEAMVGQSADQRLDKLLAARAQLIAVLERDTPPPLPQPREGAPSYSVIDKNEALVTVIVTLFNEDIYIRDSLESLKRQTLKNFKVIVVDDASVNGARAAALEAIGKDSRFRMVQHLKNGGVNAARNTGLRLADTYFTAFLDADDILMPDSLERRLNRFLEIEDDLVAGVFNGIIPGPEDITADYAPSNRKWSGVVQTFINTRGQCPFGMHAPLLRTDILRSVGGFDEGLRAGAEDWEMWQRILRCGYVFSPADMLGGVYRLREGSRIRQAPREHTQIGRSIIDAAYCELPEEDVCEGAPHMFRKPLAHYQKEADFLSRFVNFASMAYMAGPEKFAWFCENPPFDVWRYGGYDFDYKARSKSGLIRFLALDKEMARRLDPLLDDVAERVLSQIDAHVQKRLSAAVEIEPKVCMPRAALFASGAAQAKAMLEIAAQLRDMGVAPVLVSLEMLSGDQGAEACWSSAGVNFVSYNTYLLGGDALRSQVNIVMRPYCAAVRLLLGEVPTIEVTNPHGETSLPEANGPAKADHVCARDDAAELAAGIVSGVKVATGLPPAPGRVGAAGIIVGLEERADGAADREKIRALQNCYAGERCFILGNGPSLNAVDFSALAGERVFAANGFFLKQRETGFQPTFYLVSDATVMRENRDDVAEMKADYRIFSSLCKGLQPENEDTIYYLLNRGFYEPRGEHFCVPRFSMDPAMRIFCGQSVTLTSLQFAYYMGFSDIYLLGMDFHYEVPSQDAVKGELITSAGYDPNHFSSDYVSAGMTWKVPHLERVKTAYELTRDIFENAGRKIYNATDGGRLEVFERVSFEDVVGAVKPSIVVGS